MIVPKLELAAIVNGKPGAVEVADNPPTVGEVFWLRESPRAMPACRGVVVEVRWCESGEYELLLERADETFTLPPREAPERPRLRLTRTQRAKLFDGEAPHIGGDGKPPVEPGERIRLSARLELRVIRVDVKHTTWKLHYELIDTRDTVRLLRRTPPAHQEGTEEVGTGDASEESHYTSSPRAAVEDAGEAPPRVWQEIRSKAISEFDHQRRLARYAADRQDKVGRLRERSKARRRRAA